MPFASNSNDFEYLWKCLLRISSFLQCAGSDLFRSNFKFSKSFRSAFERVRCFFDLSQSGFKSFRGSFEFVKLFKASSSISELFVRLRSFYPQRLRLISILFYPKVCSNVSECFLKEKAYKGAKAL